MIRIAACLTLLLALPAGAEAQKPPGEAMPDPVVSAIGSLAWLRGQSDFPLEFRDAGRITIAPGGIVAADPLTWSDDWDLPEIGTPTGEARFILALDDGQGRVSQAMLIFSDAAPVCGDDVATIPVDTGLASFLDPVMREALNRSYEMIDPEDLYSGWFEDLIGETWVVGHILPLPDKTLIPMTSTGWGDGGYPVARLKSASGEVVALYADFMGKNDAGDWLLPNACGST
ncbi:DUF4241 domain-containing protein [Pseudogemmobacter bohemicus]|uniref:DUF4241 domain-containing protein n=1 Tax=Pseudogemmobacter bohemicus TaxID=2250708 RepID=UPI000DD43E98|nr:DUF4241 domain-containing protein [Pseudogemmobacter bohemicus]